MFFWPQADGSVQWTGSFNQDEYDAYMAEHSTKAKVKAAAKAEAEAKPEGDKEQAPAPAPEPAQKAAAPAAKKAGTR